MRTFGRCFNCLLMIVAIVFSLFTTTRAADWTNSSGGDFALNANWNPSAPLSGDPANFDINNTFTVNFTSSPTTASLTIGGSNVTFSAGGSSQIYTVSGASTVSGSDLTLTGNNFFQLSTGSLELFGGRNLNIQQGNKIIADSYTMAANGTGTANLSVDASTFTVNSFATISTGTAASSLSFTNSSTANFGIINIGNSTSALAGTTFNILSASTVNASGNLNIGLGSVFGQITTVTVSGVNSLFRQTGSNTFVLGASASSVSTLNINTSGTFTTGTGGIFINPTATINIGGGTFNANGDISLTGGKILHTSGTFNLAAGKNLTASNGAQVSFTGSYTIANSSTFTIQSGTVLQATTFLDVGNATNGTLIVDGLGSSFSTADVPHFGANGATGNVTIRNFATATISSNLQIATDSVPGTSGFLFVQSAATMTVNSLFIGANSASGSVFVTGAGSAITQNGASLLSLGQFTGIGSLNISSSATFTTGTGASSLFPGATITVTGGGTFNLKGNLAIAGGTISASAGNFNWPTGSTLTVQSAAHVTVATLTLGSASSQTLTVQNANSQLNAATLLTIGASGHFNLSTSASSTLTAYSSVGGGDTTIDASSFTVSGATQLSTITGLATLTLQNSATGSFNSLNIGAAALNTSIGVMNVQTSSTATVSGNINVGTVGGGVRGTLNVLGSASLTQSNATSFTVGNPTSLPTAVNVSSSGTLSTGTGLLTINQNGTLTVNSGTFNANGDITVNGGAINALSGTFNWTNSKSMNITGTGSISVANLSAPLNSITAQAAGSQLIVPGTLTIGTLNVNTAAAASVGSLTLGVPAATATIDFASLTVAGAITLSTGSANFTLQNAATGILGSIDFNGNASPSTFTIQSAAQATLSGNLNLGTALGAGNNTLTVTGPGSSLIQSGATTLTIGNATTGTAILNVNPAAAVTTGTGVTTIAHTGTLAITGGTFTANGNVVVNIGGTLSIAGISNNWAGKLDLKSNALVIAYDTPPNGAALLSRTYNQVIAARGTHVNGVSDYSGNGITSSTASINNHLAQFDKFSIGVINNADLSTIGLNPAYTTFKGQTGIPVNSILARYTYAGDINLDGKINIDDYNYIDSGFGGLLSAFSGQIIGDFNNDGKINIDDYNVIDTGFGFQGAPLADGDLLPLVGPLPGVMPVPEPGCFAILALALPALCGRRRLNGKSRRRGTFS